MMRKSLFLALKLMVKTSFPRSIFPATNSVNLQSHHEILAAMVSGQLLHLASSNPQIIRSSPKHLSGSLLTYVFIPIASPQNRSNMLSSPATAPLVASLSAITPCAHPHVAAAQHLDRGHFVWGVGFIHVNLDQT